MAKLENKNQSDSLEMPIALILIDVLAVLFGAFLIVSGFFAAIGGDTIGKYGNYVSAPEAMFGGFAIMAIGAVIIFGRLRVYVSQFETKTLFLLGIVFFLLITVIFLSFNEPLAFLRFLKLTFGIMKRSRGL